METVARGKILWKTQLTRIRIRKRKRKKLQGENGRNAKTNGRAAERLPAWDTVKLDQMSCLCVAREVVIDVHWVRPTVDEYTNIFKTEFSLPLFWFKNCFSKYFMCLFFVYLFVLLLVFSHVYLVTIIFFYL